MNSWEKEVQQSLLDSEKAVIAALEKQYAQALRDIGEKIKLFQADIDLLDEALSQDGLDDATKAMLQARKQSKIYQQQYQMALKSQVGGILDKMQGDNYASIDRYLKECYETGFIGTMYSIAGQGIPIIASIDQSAAVKAILTDSKVVEGFYNRLGVDVKNLKKIITQEISRGIASALPYRDIARNINNASRSGLYNAKRIARTEGHRIQQTSARDAQYAARANGADVVKQWDAALDSRTRDSHARLDGEIRELDEKFSNGLRYPGDPSGRPEEVINCRCTSDTRARWALDEAELQTLKDRAAYFGLDKTQNFAEYKQRYLEISTDPKYNTLQKLRYSGDVTPELESELEQSLLRMPERHRELAESKISGIEVTDSKIGSSYTRSSGIIKISKYASSDDIIHEYAHALSDVIGAYNDPIFRKILYKGFENISPLDVIYDEIGFSEPIYRVESSKFVSTYQGRLYEKLGIFNGKDISLDGMLDYFSEGYVEYIRNPDNLKKHDPDLFNYFRGIT